MAALRAALRTCTRLGNIGVGEAVARQVVTGAPLVSPCRGLRTPPAISSALSHATPWTSRQEVVVDDTEAERNFSHEVIGKVDQQVREGLAGRLFAVVFLQGKQHLVTPGDLVVVQTYFPPNTGDALRLEKVMMVGSRDFSLYGRPLLGQDLVRVEATVVEKTLSHCRIYFYNRRRKNSRKTKFKRETHTLLRINRIEITHGINEVPEVTGVDGRTL
ncbi:39S ribosomal protein L21, mitochondrial-like isoform X2 [Portunus trituberculatus]|uniref:39S ribosomal protein L21, mitochondrial-like isoform X2 n=1 Tax=Portunus trituberculatus TaxID=210409 RepID=UPI001E1CB1DD|nr:39S ribosomal protein L21, mitochondrial-like isoform X2 [Portunus trituberculatus]